MKVVSVSVAVFLVSLVQDAHAAGHGMSAHFKKDSKAMKTGKKGKKDAEKEDTCPVATPAAICTPFKDLPEVMDKRKMDKDDAGKKGDNDDAGKNGAEDDGKKGGKKTSGGKKVRFATFNASLNRNSLGELAIDLSTTANVQANVIATVIQLTRPDILLINEFDYDERGTSLRLFQDNYLSIPHPQFGAQSIHYPYRYTAPSNTGIPSGFDYNNNGAVGGGDDAYGFGVFPGQFGMAFYSMYPIDEEHIRTFQLFKWKDMPCAFLPFFPQNNTPWYTPGPELDSFRLSSKSHWDIPVKVVGRVIHALSSHPTPPVFDGLEDRNGKRNHDEIRFWKDYISRDHKDSSYIYDDDDHYGGLDGRHFVILGDLNADPNDGDSFNSAVRQLTDNELINNSTTPVSLGAVQLSTLDGGANVNHCSDPKFDTADFADTTPGNLRADYVLPSATLDIADAGVFWPPTTDPFFSALIGRFPFPSSDHKLVWVDIYM